MGKITTYEYAQMANLVYQIDTGANFYLSGFRCDLFDEGMSWGATKTDFKGCVYVSDEFKEVVVAFQGTKPSKLGDVVADVQILVGMLPQYCGAAMRLFDRAVAAYGDHAMTLVGHSLGGGMAQVIGHWTGIPFVTFNAPGMWGDIQRSKFLLWQPSNMIRSLKGTFKGSLFSKQMASTGRNFRNVLDPVSAYGFHYGPVTRFWGKGVHSMDDVAQRIFLSRWSTINPLDPLYKEWGEL
jgi:hypothetical protein